MHRSRVDAFRHRAEAIMADHSAVSHVYRFLTLMGGRGLLRREGVMRHECHPPRIVPDIASRA